MKIESVEVNNRKKCFEVSTGEAEYPFPYVLLPVSPSASNRVAEAFPDPELGEEGFTYRLDDGTEETVHLDAVLEYNEDPSYLNELLLHRLTVEALKALETTGLGKRELARALGTSAAQLYRLLDPTNHSKSIGQMLALLHVLGRKVDVVVTPRSMEGKGGGQGAPRRGHRRDAARRR
ncbi:MAG: hypothetical protein LJF04_19830 [Gemmatimonadetes bacterium]|nr:hypothetical protein [Gemmatimonadota bacterium]